jgi:hypothetical protein
MRIAIIAGFNDLDVRGWTPAFAFSNKFEAMGHTIDTFNMYKLDSIGNYLGYTDDSLRDFISQQHNYDFVLLLDCWNFISPLFAYIDIPSIIDTGNDPLSFQQNLSKAQYFDIICSPDKRCVEKYRKHGFNAYWLKPWVDADIHYPEPDKYCDKLVVGVTQGWGGEGISHYMRVKLKNLWLDCVPDNRYELNKLLNRGKIIFCHSVYGELVNLIFEAAACGNMVLINHIDEQSGIYDLFKDGIDVLYYTTWKDAICKIMLLKDNEEKIRSIAQSGYRKVIAQHTLDCRVNEILKILKERERGFA